MMNSSSAVHLCKEHPECLQAMEVLLTQEKDAWIPVKDIRESAGIEMNVWKSLMQKLGEYNGIGYIETSRSRNKSWPSQVRIRSGYQDSVQRLIEAVRA